MSTIDVPIFPNTDTEMVKNPPLVPEGLVADDATEFVALDVRTRGRNCGGVGCCDDYTTVVRVFGPRPTSSVATRCGS